MLHWQFPRCEWQTPDLELIGVHVHRLDLTVQRVVLSVQWMFLTVLTGLHHLHRDLNVTQRLLTENMSHWMNAQHHTRVWSGSHRNAGDSITDNTSSSAIFCFSSSSVRMSGGVFTLENKVLRFTFIVLKVFIFYFYFQAVLNSFKCTATSCSPKVMRDAGVELVARFHKVALAALCFQTILDLFQGHVAGADLARRQLPCVRRHRDSSRMWGRTVTDVMRHHVVNCTVLYVWNSGPWGNITWVLKLVCQDYRAHVKLMLHFPECSAGILSD